MEVLLCDITIGNYSFDFVHTLEIESSWKTLTDKAMIKLPAALRIDKDKLQNAFPKGTPVSIRIGYQSEGLKEKFNGFVSRVHPKVPVEIECEDLMWKLKQIQVNENLKNEPLGTYLQRVLQIEVDCFEITIPRLIANKITGAQLLDQIKSDYGFPSFIRAGKLVVGKQYDPNVQTKHIVIIDQATNSNVKKQDLEYAQKDDVKLKVTAISNMANGDKVEVVVGDPEGEDRTLNFYDIPQADLKAIAEKEMERFNYDGYRGDLTLYGEPSVQHGDILVLQNTQESDKTGEYFIDEVVCSFGVNGYEQRIKPGAKI
jgi:hypothetical protein